MELISRPGNLLERFVTFLGHVVRLRHLLCDVKIQLAGIARSFWGLYPRSCGVEKFAGNGNALKCPWVGMLVGWGEKHSLLNSKCSRYLGRNDVCARQCA